MVDISQEPLVSLFKDGISEEIYKLLWSKDELNFGPSVNIPDTVIYKYGQPHTWYFTSINGKIKKKNKQNLVSAKIEEAFNKHVMGYDVLAYFISIPTEHELEQNPNLSITIEYLDRVALNDFLYTRKKEVNGILQRFIEPKTTRNELIRAIWSPKVCLLERAENIHQLHDQRYGLYERCVIYEGPEYYYTSAPLRGPVLSGQIQKIAETIVAHIAEVTYGQKQVSRIVLNMKVDSRDKIWLLYSTSIRCVDMLEYSTLQEIENPKRTLLNIDSVITLADSVHLNPTKSYEKIVPKKRIRCLSCCKETLEDLRHPVTYKSVIKHYDHVLYLLTSNPANPKSAKKETISWPPDAEMIEAAGGVGFGQLYVNDFGEMMNEQELSHHVKNRHVKDLQIPPILQSIHGKLNKTSYLRCKHDPLFLYKTVNVCEPCFLVYAEFTSMLLRLGQDLTKLLTPDPAAASVAIEKSFTNRPSTSDWRAMSSANSVEDSHFRSSVSRPGALGPSANHARALSNAIGIRSNESISQPDVPGTIRKSDALGFLQQQEVGMDSQFSQSKYSSFNEMSPSRSITGGAQLQGGSSLYDADAVQSMIAERERHFFKEVAMNPQLKNQHPLMHLISSQQKMKLIDQQSGVLMSKSSGKMESMFGTKYGRQTGDEFHKYASYGAEIPYAVNGEIVLPSVLRERKKNETLQAKLKKQKTLRSLMDDVPAELAQSQSTLSSATNVEASGNVAASDASSRDNRTSSSSKRITKKEAAEPLIAKASKKHREFLDETLRKLEAELEGAEPFVGKRTAAEDGTLTSGSHTLDPYMHKGRKPSSVHNAAHSTPVASVRSESQGSKKKDVSPKKQTPKHKKSSRAGRGEDAASTGTAEDVHALNDNASLADNGSVTSTESALLRSFGIDPSTLAAHPDEQGALSESDDRANLMQASDALLAGSKRGSLDNISLADNQSLGEFSTESSLLNRWGIHALESSVEDRSRAQDEAKSFYEMMDSASAPPGGQHTSSTEQRPKSRKEEISDLSSRFVDSVLLRASSK